MVAFSMIDMLSCLDEGTQHNQTSRMRRLLTERLDAAPAPAAVAVQMWRHSLMHTGSPREVVDARTGVRYQWLLHWSDELPREQHLILLPGHRSDSQVLGAGVTYLVDDLLGAAGAIFDGARKTSEGRAKVIAGARQLAMQHVSLDSQAE